MRMPQENIVRFDSCKIKHFSIGIRINVAILIARRTMTQKKSLAITFFLSLIRKRQQFLQQFFRKLLRSNFKAMPISAPYIFPFQLASERPFQHPFVIPANHETPEPGIFQEAQNFEGAMIITDQISQYKTFFDILAANLLQYCLQGSAIAMNIGKDSDLAHRIYFRIMLSATSSGLRSFPSALSA